MKNFFSRYGFTLLIIGIVIFRFIYSLTTEFWFKDEDVLQIYLIGLKSFTTHTFPYFGADLVYNGAQIPGGLQGFIVSALWYVWKIPEAPFIVLNIVLTLSLGFLAWYLSKRLQDISRTFIWIYVFLIPWSICYFTRVINPSHVIPGAILFFIGIFEIYPQIRKNILPQWLCFYFLGLGSSSCIGASPSPSAHDGPGRARGSGARGWVDELRLLRQGAARGSCRTRRGDVRGG